MQGAEQKLLDIMASAGVDFVCSLPCDRTKTLLPLLDRSFFHLPLTREEEGVGITAGAALSGKRPAMVLQSSGIGNMVNALCSLTGFYGLPLALFISHRGVYKEGIAAQVPMGKALPGLLDSIGIAYSVINDQEGLVSIASKLEAVYDQDRIHAFLLSPALWEGCLSDIELPRGEWTEKPHCVGINQCTVTPELTRYGVIEQLVPMLDKQIVIANLGVPSKELYALLEQPTNFYMLGSMGMATPIGLGVSLCTDKRVYVIDGDGSLLMNPGSLATVAQAAPSNLVILAIDNASYGSTGSQPTMTGATVDLELVARGMGIRNTVKAASGPEIAAALEKAGNGPLFVHIPAISGNAAVSDIPVAPMQMKTRFMQALGA